MSKAAELAALIGSQTALSNRSLIINGAMEIYQRAASVTSVSDATYVVQDRMNFFSSNDGVISVFADSTHPTGAGFSKSLKVDVTTADASIAAGQYLAINQRIEGLNHARLEYGTASAKPIVVSFYAKSNLTGPFCYSVKNNDGDRSFPIEFSLSAANTWERISFTIPGDTSGTWLETNGIGAYHQIALAMGSTFHGTNNTWQAGNKVATSNQVNLLSSTDNEFFLTGWQVEIGSGAPTAFEHRSFGDELQKCKRYFFRTDTFTFFPIPRWSASSGRPLAQYNMPVTMRAAPSVSISTSFTDGQSYSGTPVFGDQNTTNFYIGSSQASASANNIYWAHNGVLDISAEL